MGKRVFADARMMLMMCGIVVMMMAMGPLISAQLECRNVFGVYMQCGRYIEREGATVPPSSQCCSALERSNVTCMCPYFADYEDTYSTEKVIYVLNYCETPLASGTKCGNYTAP
ncbi:protein LIM3-like [Vigna radiata var. radiata]|uniref:Protein LIM3-like n=1 Tax=Vigna radiata var. radiata TaxID=3916 RepID=A0A1S3UE17_VIGRR|nr:protein LIM3-like [Vigna radiata var. radiata]